MKLTLAPTLEYQSSPRVIVAITSSCNLAKPSVQTRAIWKPRAGSVRCSSECIVAERRAHPIVAGHRPVALAENQVLPGDPTRGALRARPCVILAAATQRGICRRGTRQRTQR